MPDDHLDLDLLPPEPPRQFEVRDPTGRLVATQIRSQDPNTDEKVIWWRSPQGRSGLGGLPQSDLPLYRCERLRRVPLDVPVVVTEGPKDCDAVWRAHIPSVGTLTGASGLPSAQSLEVLRDRIVILWPDNDNPGRQHMERLAAAIDGVTREVRWLDVPNLAAGGGAGDLSPDEVAAAVRRYARAYVGGSTT